MLSSVFQKKKKLVNMILFYQSEITLYTLLCNVLYRKEKEYRCPSKSINNDISIILVTTFQKVPVKWYWCIFTHLFHLIIIIIIIYLGRK